MTYKLETLDFAFYICSTPTFLYFDLYLNTAHATHYAYMHYILIWDYRIYLIIKLSAYPPPPIKHNTSPYESRNIKDVRPAFIDNNAALNQSSINCSRSKLKNKYGIVVYKLNLN